MPACFSLSAGRRRVMSLPCLRIAPPVMVVNP